MGKSGFHTIKLSRGGPELDANGHPAASREDKLKAVDLNAAWDAVRKGLPAPRKPAEKPLAGYPGVVMATCAPWRFPGLPDWQKGQEIRTEQD